MAELVVESVRVRAFSSADEAERLTALDGYDILDTPAEAGFDDLVLLASQICQTPVALVSLVAGDRQWFKARVGFDLCQTPIAQSVCWHALQQPGLLIIPDLAEDLRTRNNALVTEDPHIRFYAGARLETPDGVALGTLCVIDSEPRPQGLTDTQAKGLEALARQVMSQMELRRTAASRDQVQSLNSLIMSSSRDCIVVLDLEARTQFVSAGGIEAMEITDVGSIVGLSWLRVWAGADLDAARIAVDEARSGRTGRFQGFCPTHKGTPKWWDCLVSPLRGPDGKIERLVSSGRDITAAKTIERELAQSQERLNLALGASGMIGIWDWDLKTGLVHSDKNFARIYSVDPAWAARGAPLAEYLKHFHADDLPGFQAELDGLFAGADEFSSEYRVLQPDGSARWVLARGRLVRDRDGTPLRFPGASVDITERKQAEARRLAVLELGDRLRDLTDPAAMAFAAAEIMGRSLDASRAGYGTVNAAKENVTVERDWTMPGVASIAGTHAFRDFGSISDDLRQGATVAIDDVLQDPRTAVKAGAFGAIGIRTIVNIPVLEHGAFVAVFFIHGAEPRTWSAEQITFVRNVADRTRAAIQRRHAELRLQELNAELEQRVEERTRERDRVWRNSRDLLIVVDRQGVLRSVSPAAMTILGWSSEEMVGSTVFDFVHPDDRRSTGGSLNKTQQDILPIYLNRYRRKDGAYRWMSWVAAPEDDMIFAYGRDVTAEKEQAEALQQAEEQLRQSQKMEAVGQLTGGVAHDFNNLLTVIRSSVDLLKRPDLSEERRQRYIEAIADTTTRASKLTGQLLAFARRQALHPEVFDVGTALDTIADMVGTLTGSRVAIETRLPDGPCLVHADPSQFDTAVVNLAVNARDAMHGEGRLTIAVGRAARIPAMRSHPPVDGDFVTLSVTDTGSGIPPADLDRIFEPFFTTKEVGQGTGLGLSQVFGFVKQSGGEVAVSSDLGRGTTFTLYLPRASAPGPSARTQDDAEPSIEGHGVHVLVVEDNAAVGSFATQALAELGYTTVLATGAAMALAELAADAQRFDIVFSDVVMPGQNGIELAREIRHRHPALPVVLTSGYSHVLVETGSDGFELLQKPYSVEQLSRVLQKAVRSQPAIAADERGILR